jgi:hypothetical protein
MRSIFDLYLFDIDRCLIITLMIYRILILNLFFPKSVFKRDVSVLNKD